MKSEEAREQEARRVRVRELIARARAQAAGVTPFAGRVAGIDVERLVQALPGYELVREISRGG